MGHRLRQQRTLLGLTREEFAELADISAGYYGQIEVGTSQMSIDTLIKLARSSRLSMEYILLGEERSGKPDLTTIDGLLADYSPGSSVWRRRCCGCFCCGGTRDLPGGRVKRMGPGAEAPGPIP